MDSLVSVLIQLAEECGPSKGVIQSMGIAGSICDINLSAGMKCLICYVRW